MALQKALAGLSPRTADVLRAELEKGPFLPYPYHRARLAVNPRSPGVPWQPLLPGEALAGEVVLRMVRLAVDRVLRDVPRLEQRSPGTVSRATRRAIECLTLVYCRCHNAPRPTGNAAARTIRNPAALEFALDCLRAWYTPGIGSLAPEDVIRSLKLNNN